MPREKLFTPLGVDYIVIACYSRHYWREVLKHIGFQEFVAQQYENNSDVHNMLEQTYGAALKFGNVKFLLVDPSTGTYNPKQIHEFLVRNGDFQVCSVGIAVDSAVRAQEELGGSLITRSDPFGEVASLTFPAPLAASFWWELVERPDAAETFMGHAPFVPLAVDHTAIAVEDLKEAADVYRKLGFRTVYRPRSEIRGEYSGMKTVAMQRGGWTVALVEGVDGDKRSQVSAYMKAHGNHSVQHIALRFANVESAVEKMHMRQVQFRSHAVPFGQAVSDANIIHYGKDHMGVLLQAFTKPFLRFLRWDAGGVFTADGLFFECMECLQTEAQEYKRGFYNKTVKGLYRSIEAEEIGEGNSDTLLPYAVMSRFEYDTRFSALTRREAWKN